MEAANAEQVREGEVIALLAERSNVLAQREAAQGRSPEKRLIIVDEHDRPVPGLHIKNITAALDRERIEEEVRKLDAHLETIDRELRARGHKPSRGGK
jgi:hypothetical protein